MDDLNRFVKFAKINEEERTVCGLASDETLDSEDEVIDYEATKQAVADWSAWGNIREMHGPNAAGVAVSIELDDMTRALRICAKIVDDQAWRKVKEGVYKGFSIGGKKLRVIQEMLKTRMIKRVVEYLLNEISLVDRPANPSAKFSMIKRDLSGGDTVEVEEEAKNEAGQDEDATKAAGSETAEAAPPEETTKAEGSSEEAGQEEVEGEEGQPMTMAATRDLVMTLLKDLGLIPAELAQASQVGDLQKTIGTLAKAADLQKVIGDLQKMIGDLVKVATVVDALDERLEKVEQMPAGSGPVLREIGAFGVTDQSEAVLKALINETTDPAMKQAIGQKLVELQVKGMQGNVINR